MSKKKIKLPISISYRLEKIQKILTLDPRVFDPCKAKEVEQWSWKRLKNEKWFVHLKKYTNKWNVQKLS